MFIHAIARLLSPRDSMTGDEPASHTLRALAERVADGVVVSD